MGSRTEGGAPEIEKRFSRILAAIAADPLLALFPRAAIARLLPVSELMEAPEGEMLLVAGAPTSYLYVLVSGGVEAHTADGRRIFLAEGRAGEEILAGHPEQTMTVVTTRPSVLVKIQKSGLADRVKDAPEIGAKAREALIARLASAPPDSIPIAISRTAKAGRREIVGWILALVLPLAVIAGLQWYNARIPFTVGCFAAVFVAAICMWVFALVDEFVPPMFVVAIVLVLGLTPEHVTLEGFGDDTLFLFLGVYVLGVVVDESGLFFRYMLWLLGRVPTGQFWYRAILLGSGFILSPIVTSGNSRVPMVAPLYREMLEGLGVRRRGPMASALATATFSGATIMSAMFLTSKPSNLLVIGMLPEQARAEFDGAYWFTGAAVAGVVVIFSHFFADRLVFGALEAPPFDKRVIKTQLRVLGALSGLEWTALLGLALFLVGAATGGWHHLSLAQLSALLLVCLLLLGVISKTAFQQRVDWALIFFLLSLNSLTAIMRHLAVTEYFSEPVNIMGGLLGDSPVVFVIFEFITVLIIRQILPTTAGMITAALLLMPLAPVIGFSPWIIGFLASLFSDAWIFPHQNGPYLQFRAKEGGPTGSYDERAFLRHNLVIGAGRLAAALASIPYWSWLGLL